MVIIPEPLTRQIHAHGEETFPEECCGVLLGTIVGGKRSVRTLIAIPNSRGTDRQRRFLITPEQYSEAEARARTEQLDLLGFYHSHPDHPARPSEFDREHAFPWFVYVIVSVIGGRSAATTAWELSDDRERFSELPVIIDHPERSGHHQGATL